MRKIASIVVSSLSGAVVCAVLASAIFMIGAMLDGTRAEEAFAYSVIVGIICAFLGAMIGFVTGAGNLRLVSSGIVGFLATLAVVAFYVLAFSRPGQQLYFLSQSGIFFIVLTLPTVLAGIATAVVRNTLSRSDPKSYEAGVHSP